MTAVAGLGLFKGAPRFANLQIARRVREQGLIDGDCHVLVHQVRRRGADYQVLYTAMAKSEWLAVQEWIDVQRQPLKVVPLIELMLRRCMPQRGSLMLCRNQLYFLARYGEATLFASTTMFSTEAPDLEAAVALLMSKVLDDAPEVGVRELPLDLLLAVSPQGSSEMVAAVQRALSGYRVEAIVATWASLEPPAAVVCSSIPDMLGSGGGLQSLGDLKSRGAWWADRWFPLTLPVFAVLVAGLIAQTHATWLKREDQRVRQGISLVQADMADAQLRALAPPPDSLEAEVRDQVRFFGELERAMVKPDILHVVRSVESAASGRVRVTAVRSVDVRTPAPKPGLEPGRRQEVVVEGDVPKVDGVDRSIVLSEFLRSLRELGYDAQPATPRASSSASDDRFAYQLKRREKEGA